MNGINNEYKPIMADTIMLNTGFSTQDALKRLYILERMIVNNRLTATTSMGARQVLSEHEANVYYTQGDYRQIIEDALRKKFADIVDFRLEVEPNEIMGGGAIDVVARSLQPTPLIDNMIKSLEERN